MMENTARGYIASGEFNGIRAPQHIQNQIIRLYCERENLIFVLSRAEYWMNGSTESQLWAALNEGYKHIVFFSIWQLPERIESRLKIYKACTKNNIKLHFATERFYTDASPGSINDIEILIHSHFSLNQGHHCDYIKLKKLLSA